MKTRIGVIGDTHGLVHPSLPQVFSGVDEIIHAGDVDRLRVLEALSAIAPVRGVKGNYDTEPGLKKRLLPDPSGIKVAGCQALLTHRMFTMGWDSHKQLIAEYLNKGGQTPRLVIFGHTHFPVLNRYPASGS